jgi:hypothetical protein
MEIFAMEYRYFPRKPFKLPSLSLSTPALFQ